MPKRVTMFVQNGVHMDNRVLKEARVLRDAGWHVTIVGKRTSPSFLEEEDFEGIRILRVGGEQRLRGRLTTVYNAKRQRISQRSFSLQAPQDWGDVSKFTVSKGLRYLYTVPSTKALAAAYRAVMRVLAKTEPFTYLWDWYEAVNTLGDTIKAHVWHAHDIDTLPIALRMRARYGGKVIYDAHEYWLDCNNVYNRFEYATWAALEATLIHLADQTITVSQSVAEVLAKRYRVAPPALVLNTPNFHAVARNRSLRDKHGIADDRFVVIYVGLITHQRGYEQLIDSLPLIEDGVLVFMGPGDAKYMQTLQAQAQRNGVSDRVIFAGAVNPDEIQRYTAAADVGVVVGQRGSISYECALPSKYFEYVFAGLPVATSAFVEMERLSKEYQLGETFDERNPVSIAEALGKIRAGLDKYQGPAWDERRQALAAKYAWNTHKDDLLKIYDSLVLTQESYAKV